MTLKEELRIIKKAKRLIRRRRVKKAISVNLRWSARRIRNFFRRDGFVRGVRGTYARRLYTMLALLLAVGGLTVASAKLSDSWLADEAVLVRRLSDPDYNRKNPILSALDCFGSTNRIQVSLQTVTRDNLNPLPVDLDQGNINLVMTLKDGKMMEYTLQNRRIDNFESGYTDQFTLILPDSISVFDIAEYKLVLMPDVKGEYGSWHCRWAQVSFLLGGERVLLAEDDWKEPYVFSADHLDYSLQSVASENAHYVQASELYPYVLAVCREGQETVHTAKIKEKALQSLGMSNGDVHYLDVETVGLENQNTIAKELMGEGELLEHDLMDYDGTMSLRVRFYAKTAGSFYKDYPLDTPGKDDFELGNTSVFALTMPEGLSVFDIMSMELLVHDAGDTWAPRMIRAYLNTDYGTVLELARLTDVTLAKQRRTCVFRRGLIETAISPVALDLNTVYQLPPVLKEQIEEKYFTHITDVTYSMYFNEFSFYERQKLFYSQVLALR